MKNLFLTLGLIFWVFAPSAIAQTADECALVFHHVRILQKQRVPSGKGMLIDPSWEMTGQAFGLAEGSVGLGIKTAVEKLKFESPRLKMRNLEEQDSRTALLRQLEDPSMLIYWSGANSFMTEYGIWLPSVMLRMLELTSVAMKEKWAERSITLAITEKSNGEVVGYVDWIWAHGQKKLYIGYGIFNSFRNQGYAQEVVRALVQKLRVDFPDYSIHANASVQNRASQNVLLKSGFQTVESEVEGLASFIFPAVLAIP